LKGVWLCVALRNGFLFGFRWTFDGIWSCWSPIWCDESCLATVVAGVALECVWVNVWVCGGPLFLTGNWQIPKVYSSGCVFNSAPRGEIYWSWAESFCQTRSPDENTGQKKFLAHNETKRSLFGGAVVKWRLRSNKNCCSARRSGGGGEYHCCIEVSGSGDDEKELNFYSLAVVCRCYPTRNF